MIDKFIFAMEAAGCAPADGVAIRPDNQWHDYQISLDPPGKKKGYYIVSEFGGGFGDRRTGEWHTWKPRINKAWSAQERGEWKLKIDAAKAAQDKIRYEAYDAAADKARMAWSTATEATDHPYLTRKAVKPYGTRRDVYGNLLIPLYWEGRIVNLQSISREGDKLFIAKARKKGCYYMIGKPESALIVAEGFATAATVHEATDICTVVALDAHNLKPVASVLRERYPELKIIIAGDNDAHLPKNIGITKAKEAAEKIGAVCVWPEFQEGEHGSDFNDLCVLHGLDAVKNRILSALQGDEASGGQLPALQPESELAPVSGIVTEHLAPVFDQIKFNKLLKWKSPEMLERNSLVNILVYLRHHWKYSGWFRHDRFTDRILLYQCPVWEKPENFKVRKVSDADYGYIEEMFERETLAPLPTKIITAVNIVARENWINPPLNYFEGTKWDGQARLCSWLREYLDASDQPPEYLSAVGSMWMIAAVARIYQPGCKAENMIVLEGKQGKGKSRALAILANIGATRHETESYFCDTLNFSKIHEKDTVAHLQGKMIVEFAELAKLGAREVEEVKSWMSIQVDEVRKAYGRESEIYPRQFVLAGTTNESTWMRDPTGGRRFWPVRCGENFNLEGLEAAKDQLWAEAVHLYKNGAHWWISANHSLWEIAESQQSARLREDVWSSPVLDAVRGKKHVKVAAILKELGIDQAKQTQREADRVCGILTADGWMNKTVWENGRSVRAWVNPMYIEKPIDEDGEEIPFV